MERFFLCPAFLALSVSGIVEQIRLVPVRLTCFFPQKWSPWAFWITYHFFFLSMCLLAVVLVIVVVALVAVVVILAAVVPIFPVLSFVLGVVLFLMLFLLHTRKFQKKVDITPKGHIKIFPGLLCGFWKSENLWILAPRQLMPFTARNELQTPPGLVVGTSVA